MLKLIVSNAPAAPPPPRPTGGPCTHGYAMPGNCIRCTPPPTYAPMRGPKS